MSASDIGWCFFGAFVTMGIILWFDHYVEINGVVVDLTFKQINDYAKNVKAESPERTKIIEEWQLRELEIIENWRIQPYYKKFYPPPRPEFN